MIGVESPNPNVPTCAGRLLAGQDICAEESLRKLELPRQPFDIILEGENPELLWNRALRGELKHHDKARRSAVPRFAN
jgi:hypothetical protein